MATARAYRDQQTSKIMRALSSLSTCIPYTNTNIDRGQDHDHQDIFPATVRDLFEIMQNLSSFFRQLGAIVETTLGAVAFWHGHDLNERRSRVLNVEQRN